MQIDVVGAGMAGLLAAGMLRRQCNAVWEVAPSLPNNHSAVLRFRSSVVGDTLNIPFKQVTAIKAVEPFYRNPIADALAYSRKTNGTSRLRSVLTADNAPVARYIAPPDMVERMAQNVMAPIEFGSEYPFWVGGDRPVISTIPMPALMKALGYKREVDFGYRPGHNLVVQLEDVDAYCSLYVPDPSFPAGRISITGSEMIAELCQGWVPEDEHKFATQCANKLGLHYTQVKAVELKKQKYAKILPIDEDERRRFILWASQERGVYSLGRFATWRPGLLLDDVVNDVRVIQRLIAKRGASYDHHLKG